MINTNNSKIKNEDFFELLGMEETGSMATLQLPDPTLFEYWNNYKNRIIWVSDEINDRMYEYVSMIYRWNYEDELNQIPMDKRKNIIIFLASPGGELMSMWGLIDAMKVSKTDVITINASYAYSAASIILINGTKGKRYAMPHSQVLFHNGSIGGGGSQTYEQSVALNDSYKKLVAKMQENIVENTDIPKATLTKKLKATGDWYLELEDQLKYGVVDQELTDLSILFQ